MKKIEKKLDTGKIKFDFSEDIEPRQLKTARPRLVMDSERSSVQMLMEGMGIFNEEKDSGGKEAVGSPERSTFYAAHKQKTVQAVLTLTQTPLP